MIVWVKKTSEGKININLPDRINDWRRLLRAIGFTLAP
jgi:hypothetical protein